MPYYSQTSIESHGIIYNKRVRAPFITTAYFIPI
nr:MAG TPA: hypothetical protein [Caudoviricetes sp.]